MSATEELRAMLDERGVKWNSATSPTGGIWTYWDAFNGHRVYARDNENGTVIIFGEWDVTPEQAVEATLGAKITGETSDGYHTFGELYHHRAVLFSVIVRDHRELAWKSMKHHDGTMYEGMFIVGIDTPKGQATYHYDVDPYWDMFDCRELECAPEWDGHSPSDAIERIATLGRDTFQLKPWEMERDTGFYDCMECACGYVADVADWAEWHYCPNCGRNVVAS